MIHYLDQQDSILGNYLVEIRDIDIQQDPMRFRANLHKIGAYMATELSKSLNYESIDVQTPLGISACKRVSDQLVLTAILRA